MLIVCLFAHHWSHSSWLLFVLLFLLPALSMLGYAANARVGAAAYNAVNTYIVPVALAAGYSLASNRLAIFSLSLIWIAHTLLSTECSDSG